MISVLFEHPSADPREDHCFFRILSAFCAVPHAAFKFSPNFLDHLAAFGPLRVKAAL
jgi:hypothetical protein